MANKEITKPDEVASFVSMRAKLIRNDGIVVSTGEIDLRNRFIFSIWMLKWKSAFVICFIGWLNCLSIKHSTKRVVAQTDVVQNGVQKRVKMIEVHNTRVWRA